MTCDIHNCGFQGQDHDQGQQLWRKIPKANDVKKKISEKLGSKLNLGSWTDAQK